MNKVIKMNLKCALKVLKENGFVEIDYKNAKHSKFPKCSYYVISSKSQNLIDRIHKRVSESPEYICSNTRHEYNGSNLWHHFSIAKTKKVDQWLKNNCKGEETPIIGCERFIADYIRDYTNYYQSSDCNGYLIVNKKVKEERINKEKEEEEKAIELFEAII